MASDSDWDDVFAVLRDLKSDGYVVEKFGTSTSEPVEEKDLYLVVSSSASK